MLEIAICANGLPFDGSTLEKRGIGGSETAVIYVARELQKLGHNVTVFSNPDTPGVYDGVTYVPLQDLSKVATSIEWDVFIVSRQYPMLNLDIKANYRVLWNHDVFTSPQLFSCLWQTDKMFLLSDYHIDNYTNNEHNVPELRDMVLKTSNGIDLELIEKCKEGAERVPGKILYTSRPERGLHFLLQMLPKILAVRPDAKVYYCNYSLGQLVPHEADQKRLQGVQQLLAQYKDHVVNLGHLTKEQLYREMSTAEVLAYPTAFPEISCITAMEAAACGLPIVTTNAFALKETVGHNKSGYLVNGLPDGGRGTMQLDGAYAAKFVRRVLKILNSGKETKRFEKSAPAWVVDNGFTWKQVAKSWSDHFVETLADRYTTHKEAVWKELERRGNFAASDLLQGKQIDFNVLMPTFTDNDEDMRNLEKEFGAISTVAMHDNKPKDALIVMPSNPLLPVLLKRFLGHVEISVFENDPTQLEIIKEVFKGNNIDIPIVEKLEGEYDLVVCQDALAFAPNPSSLVDACNAVLREGGRAVYSTPYGPLGSLHTGKRSRLWSIGPREWNDMLDGRPAQMCVVRFGQTTEQESVGKWITSVDQLTDSTCAPINVLRFKNERPYQKLTVCMIAYNAEDWILRCMKRVLGVADKVQVVVDSKTDDRTVELLESFNDDRISWWYRDFEDFGDQRNASLEGVGEDTDPGWVMWLDTDEMLVQDAGLRKFFHGAFFNGYALPQCHLMLDVHGNRDNPIRVFRAGKPEYKFIGCIHEHCEDTSKGDYDNPITPSMIIQMVQLAHYGYENETQRRQKCSNRNMGLLQKDLQKHPRRKLNKLLAMRDYLHIPKWELDCMRKRGEQPVITEGSKLHKVLETAVDLYTEHMSKPTDKFHDLAKPHYNEALMIMATFGLKYRDCSTPPFALSTSVAAGVGGPPRTDVEPETTWFRSIEEAAAWMNTNMQDLTKQIVPLSEDYMQKLFPIPRQDETSKYSDTDGKLLGLGKNRIDKHGVLI